MLTAIRPSIGAKDNGYRALRSLIRKHKEATWIVRRADLYVERRRSCALGAGRYRARSTWNLRATRPKLRTPPPHCVFVVCLIECKNIQGGCHRAVPFYLVYRNGRHSCFASWGNDLSCRAASRLALGMLEQEMGGVRQHHANAYSKAHLGSLTGFASSSRELGRGDVWGFRGMHRPAFLAASFPPLPPTASARVRRAWRNHVGHPAFSSDAGPHMLKIGVGRGEPLRLHLPKRVMRGRRLPDCPPLPGLISTTL